MRLAKAPNVGVPAASSALGLAVVSLLTFTACGQQQPAFTEEMQSNRQNGSAAATAASGDALPAEGTEAPNVQDGSDNDTGAGGQDADGGTGGASNGGLAGGADGEISDLDGFGGGGSGGASGGGASGGGSGGTTGGSGSGGQAGSDGSGSGGADGGVTIPTVQRTVELTQKGPGKVDILWVVDTSNSMAEEQAYLGQNFGAMIDQLTQAGTNFQTAVTTTDICQDSVPSDLSQRYCPVDYGGSSATRLRGSFVGDAGKKVLKQGMSDLQSRFRQYTSLGTTGSGFEHGLKAAEMAITKVRNGQNEALMRSDAFLAVIVVSDEEDDGIGLSMVDAYNGINFFARGLTTFRYSDDDFIQYLKGVKGLGNFSVSAITPTRLSNGNLCSAPHTAPAEEGTQYINVARKTGGILQSICDTNWNNSLASIGLDLSAQVTQVVLPSTPVVSTIKVYVNGVATSAWTYNSGNNAVKFNATQVPAEGAQIKVIYGERI